MKIRYKDGVPGYDKRLGCGVNKGGIYDTDEKTAGNLVSTGKFEFVEEIKRAENIKEVKMEVKSKKKVY